MVTRLNAIACLMIWAAMIYPASSHADDRSANTYEQMAFRVAGEDLWHSLYQANNLMQYWLDEGSTQHIDPFLHAFADELLFNPVTLHRFPDPMRHLLALEKRIIDRQGQVLIDKLDQVFKTYLARYDLDNMNARHLAILANSLARFDKQEEARRILDQIEGPSWPTTPEEAQNLYGTGYFVREVAETRYLLGDRPMSDKLIALQEYVEPDQQPLLLGLGGREDIMAWDTEVAAVRANKTADNDKPAYGRDLDELSGDMIATDAHFHITSTIRAFYYEGKVMQARRYLLAALDKLAARPLEAEDESDGYLVTTSYDRFMREADLIECETCFDALEVLDDLERNGMAFSDNRRFTHDLHLLNNLVVIGRTDRATRYFDWLNEYVQTLPEESAERLPGQWTRGDAVLNMCDNWTAYEPTNIYSMSRWIGIFNITDETAIQRLRESCNYVPEVLEEGEE